MKNLNKVVIGLMLAAVTCSATALELKVKKPTRATPKPDLIVYLVNEQYHPDDPTRISVTIRNNGNLKSPSAVVSGKDMINGAFGEGSIPSIEPNSVKSVEIKFNKALNKGDRLKFVADSKNHVTESNESNNIKYFNY